MVPKQCSCTPTRGICQNQLHRQASSRTGTVTKQIHDHDWRMAQLKEYLSLISHASDTIANAIQLGRVYTLPSYGIWIPNNGKLCGFGEILANFYARVA